jgi:hypothetical protein
MSCFVTSGLGGMSGVVVDVPGGDELVRRLQIALVHDLLGEVRNDGLILFRWHMKVPPYAPMISLS